MKNDLYTVTLFQLYQSKINTYMFSSNNLDLIYQFLHDYKFLSI